MICDVDDRRPLGGPLARREITLLDAGECARVREGVLDLKPMWTSWFAGIPFYTVGAASYKDAQTNGLAAYHAKARETNPVLRERFGWLLDRLRDELSRELGVPFVFDEELALPGFHVFLFHESFTKPVASVHFDLQHKQLDWSRWPDADPEGQLTLTLSIRLPSCGAGLRLWPVSFEETARMTKDELKRVVAGEPELHAYREGRLVVHSGYQLHQIAPAVGMREDDERITLQAHAVPAGGQFVLYW
jgi:hypothetical protein